MQSHKGHILYNSAYDMSAIGKYIEIETRRVAAQGWDVRGNGEWMTPGKEHLLGVMRMVYA